MRYTHALLVLALVGWLASGGSSVLAQDTTLPPRSPSSEETILNPSVPPTPQFLQVAVDIGAGHGWLSEALLQHFPAARVIALDGSPTMLRHAGEPIGEPMGITCRRPTRAPSPRARPTSPTPA